MLEQTISRCGRADILFNNAGIILAKLLDETSESEWDRVFGLNLKSMFFGIKHVVPHMRTQHASKMEANRKHWEAVRSEMSA
jgi:NAD(P)-dependent dehydrogenase (short-subunit alcohol dehydrogenase family)